LRIKTSQAIYLISHRGLLKLENRDFPSYLSSLSDRLSTWIDSLYGGSLKLEDRDFSSYLSSLSKRLFLTLRSGFTLVLGWIRMKATTLIYNTPPPQ